MLKFFSALGSDPAITDITLMGTIIRTGPITGRIIGMADTDIIATTVIIDTIKGTKRTE